MKDKVSEFEEIVSHKEAEIISLKETLATVTQSRDKNRTDYDEMINEHNNTMNEKQNKIADLELRLTNKTISSYTGLRRITSDESLFCLKPKRTTKSAKAPNSDELKCEFEGCDKKDVDLTKCNMCSKWVCETCNDIPSAKLKPITNKCRGLYFLNSLQNLR